MGCCGKPPKINKPVDRRGNPKPKSTLSKYAYLKPNQIAIRDAEEQKDEE